MSECRAKVLHSTEKTYRNNTICYNNEDVHPNVLYQRTRLSTEEYFQHLNLP